MAAAFFRNKLCHRPLKARLHRMQNKYFHSNWVTRALLLFCNAQYTCIVQDNGYLTLWNFGIANRLACARSHPRVYSQGRSSKWKHCLPQVHYQHLLLHAPTPNRNELIRSTAAVLFGEQLFSPFLLDYVKSCYPIHGEKQPPVPSTVSIPMFSFTLQMPFSMPLFRSLDLASGADDLAQLLPAWLTPLYWILVVTVSLLSTVINAGQDYVASLGSTAKSTIALIALDSIMYFSLTLSALLLLIATIISKPWESISPAFVGPMTAFIGACVYAHSIQIHESRILALWLRISSMTIVNEIQIDGDALFVALDRAAHPPDETLSEDEDEVIALVRADSAGGLACAARNKGSMRPFSQVLKMWWQQGTATKVPTIWVRRRVNNSVMWCYTVRTVNHAVAVRRLEEAGVRILNQTQMQRERVGVRQMKVITAFNRASRHVVHWRYGNIWMRASGQPGLDKSSHGWWFIGCEIVQSLKAAVGVEFLCGTGRYENVAAMWQWVDDLGYGFRRDAAQTKPIAEEIGKSNLQDGRECASVAASLALGVPVGDDVNDAVWRVAREANVVACVGLAVRAVVPQLERTVGEFNEEAVAVLENAGARFARDGHGHVSVAAMEVDRWPEHELAIMIVKWVSAACQNAGRPTAPPPIG